MGRGGDNQQIVLFAVANPPDRPPLAFDEEVRAIVQRLTPGRLHVVTVLAATYADLRDALSRHRPHIAHLACHGEDGDLFLSDGRRGSERVAANLLVELFDLLRHDLELVVLNACSSDTLARRLAPVLGAAIGMRDAIRDDAAVRFAATLYAALAAGEPLTRAHRLAVNDLGRLGEAHQPALFLAPDATTRVGEAAAGHSFLFPLAGARQGELDLLALADAPGLPAGLQACLSQHFPALSPSRINGRRRELRLSWQGRTFKVAARPTLISGPAACPREVSLVRPAAASFFYCPHGAQHTPRYHLSLECSEQATRVELRSGDPTPQTLRLDLV